MSTNKDDKIIILEKVKDSWVVDEVFKYPADPKAVREYVADLDVLFTYPITGQVLNDSLALDYDGDYKSVATQRTSFAQTHEDKIILSQAEFDALDAEAKRFLQNKPVIKTIIKD